ncbi:hypothetical protein J2045_002156 [Peteryoungia aggregata LMG 23059]|uniref:Uncharacterized protein n=1 Tax=Peteryoungia aggregata LMG 23059 TaxID=1368425 RepID=A0ABU0G715_9HYPH|nr:hypothetical protein [Peteryoungia aggregata]MDQ0421129.1 hypothetical protein [Peteryoungia aggregata LMG 23059]
MLNSNWINFLTVLLSVFSMIGVYWYSVRATGRYFLPAEVFLGLLANVLTLSWITCFLFNTLYSLVANLKLWTPAVAQTETPAIEAGLSLAGNEVTAFLVFIYAFVMIGGGTLRNIRTACGIPHP